MLWRDLNPALLRYLRVMCGERAEQIASSTWTDVARGLRTFRGDEPSFRAWVFGIARRHALTCHRAGRDAALTASLSKAESSLQDVVTSLGLDLVAALPEMQAEVLMLRAVGGLAVEDIALMLQRSRRAVRSAACLGAATVGAAAAARAGTGSLARGRVASVKPPSPVVGRTAMREREAAFDVLLAGGPLPVQATDDLLLLAYVIDALTAAPTLAELSGSGPALDAYERYVLTPAVDHPLPVPAATRPTRAGRAAGPVRGGRLAAAFAAGAVGLGGTAMAAYAGVLPASLQDVAHQLINAPAHKPATSVPAPPGSTGSGTGAPGAGHPASGSSAAHPGNGPTGAPTAAGTGAGRGASAPGGGATGTVAVSPPESSPSAPSGTGSGGASASPPSGPPGTHAPQPSGKPTTTHPRGRPSPTPTPTPSVSPTASGGATSTQPGKSHSSTPHPAARDSGFVPVN